MTQFMHHHTSLQSAANNICLVIAAAQVFATSLNAYFQLTIMLMVLVIGVVGLAHYHPFEDSGSQGTQVSHWLYCWRSPCADLFFSAPSDCMITGKQLVVDL